MITHDILDESTPWLEMTQASLDMRAEPRLALVDICGRGSSDPLGHLPGTFTAVFINSISLPCTLSVKS